MQPGQTESAHAEVADIDQGGLPWLRWAGLALGPLAVLAMQLAGPPAGLDPKGWLALSILALMVIWWVSEAIPVAATALIPLAALPLLGVAKPAAAAAPYADPIIFLFVGGFMLAVAVERWNLHARIALAIASVFGSSPALLIGGFLLATALASMWISNTAAALMITPIAIGAARAMSRDGQVDKVFGGALVLAVAYGASIGGIGTPVGSPTNLVAMGFLEKQGLALSFPQWMLLAVPMMVVMLAMVWALLALDLRSAKFATQGDGRGVIRKALADLGPITQPELRVALVFGAVALFWMFREPLSTLPGLERLSDMAIAITGVLILFLLPAGSKTTPGPLLDWSTAEKIPWGIALLFGAGLSMAAAMEATGVTTWLGANLSWLGAFAPIVVIAAMVALVVFLTEIASNTATLTAMLPVIAAVALAVGVDPLLLAFPAAIAASFAFMMPIGTPPNAIAYATGLPSIGRMVRTGIILNLVAVVVITGITELLAPAVLGAR